MAFVVTSETNMSGEATASFSAAMPSGHLADDILLAIATQDGGATAIAASGWTAIGTQSAYGAQRTVAFWKLATGSAEADIDLTGSTDEWIVTVVVVRGANTTAPINTSAVSNEAAPTGVMTSPAATTTADNCLLIYAWGQDSVPKLIPEDPNAIVVLARDTDFVGCTQIAGYRNQPTAGAVPTVSAFCEVTSEAGQTRLIAIEDATPSTPQMGPMIDQGYQVVKRYGGITTAATNVAAFIRHDGITWDVATTLAASTIAGLTIINAPTFAEVAYQDPNRPWGSMTGLSCGGSAIDNTGRWVGATHAMTATDMTDAIFSIEFMKSAVTSSRFGAQGVVAVFQDSAGNWAAFQLSPRAGMVGAVSYTAQIDLAGTPYDSGGAIDWSDITRLGYLYHKRTTSTTTHILRVKNAILLRGARMVDGCADAPCSPALAQQMLDGWGPVGLASLQGAGQSLPRAGLAYGDGTRKTVVTTAATSHEMPPAPNTSIARRFWQVLPYSPAAAFRITASADDVVDLSACVMAIDVPQDWIIDAASSPLASYAFTGAALIGWAVQINADVTVGSATFKGTRGIVLTDGKLMGCTVTGSATSPAVTTADLEMIEDTAFVSAGSGHAIRLTGTGTFALSGCTFTGYGSGTDAAIFNDSGGAVTINLPIGSDVPTVLNGAGASTTIVSPTTVQIAGGGSDTIQMRRLSDHVVLATRTGPGEMNIAAQLGETVYFARVNSGQTVASSFTDPITVASGDNGTVPLFVGAEVQIGNIDSVASEVWAFGTRTLTSGGGGTDPADIWSYATRTLTSGGGDLTPVMDALEVVNSNVKKASIGVPAAEDLP